VIAFLSRPKPTLRPSGRSGFTLVELVIVVMVIGLLAAIGIPNFQRAVLKARATEAVSELHVIRVAVMGYLADTNTWPAEVARGRIPSGLGDYLPDGFSFAPEAYTIDYDNWSGTSEGFIGLAIITAEPELGAAMVDMLGSNAWTNGSDKFTWVIEWVE
jgi:prepilin-type N-terminal cleavage/methylation domain-containing protein